MVPLTRESPHPSGTLQVEVWQIEIKVGPYYHLLPFTSEGLKAAIEILKTIKAPAEKPR